MTVESLYQLAAKVAEIKADLLEFGDDERGSTKVALMSAQEDLRQEAAYEARQLVKHFEDCGLVLTVEQRPLLPLAMGNYETVVSVREARQ
jgi:hypothetical protein